MESILASTLGVEKERKENEEIKITQEQDCHTGE
jgi:hypothetical protein